jgi:hypothetical protein
VAGAIACLFQGDPEIRTVQQTIAALRERAANQLPLP